MKTYCFQLSTGVIFRTTQQIVYTSNGYAVDRETLEDESSVINGEISIPGRAQPIDVTDMEFSSKNITASWVEE